MTTHAYIHWLQTDGQPNTPHTEPSGVVESSQQWPLNKREVIIGRQPPAEIVVPIPNLSRRHAAIEETDLGYALRDLGSTNGTFLNGEPVGVELVPLVSNDKIVLGSSVTLLFADPEETPQIRRIGKLQGIWIDPETQSVWVDALPVQPALSPAQGVLLKLIYDADGTVVTREQIIVSVWPDVDPSGVSEDAVDALIKRLRKRLREVQPRREYIQVVRGHGLRLGSQ